MDRVYLVFDSRARDGSTDGAAVCASAETLSEAKRMVMSMFPDGVVYSHLVEPVLGEGGLNGNLFDERFEWMDDQFHQERRSDGTRKESEKS